MGNCVKGVGVGSNPKLFGGDKRLIDRFFTETALAALPEPNPEGGVTFAIEACFHHSHRAVAVEKTRVGELYGGHVVAWIVRRGRRGRLSGALLPHPAARASLQPCTQANLPKTENGAMPHREGQRAAGVRRERRSVFPSHALLGVVADGLPVTQHRHERIQHDYFRGNNHAC